MNISLFTKVIDTGLISGFDLNFSFLKFLEDISPFYEATDTPVLDFWWHLP